LQAAAETAAPHLSVIRAVLSEYVMLARAHAAMMAQAPHVPRTPQRTPVA
jgi:hypothetical protein